jgi:N-carbamoyl-L-amino-acid hydrolase
MHPAVIAGLHDAAAGIGQTVREMPCGAGHDAATFADLGVPTGMLFLRNENGSHNPEEHLEMDDFAAGARLLLQFCLCPPDRPE